MRQNAKHAACVIELRSEKFARFICLEAAPSCTQPFGTAVPVQPKIVHGAGGACGAWTINEGAAIAERKLRRAASMVRTLKVESLRELGRVNWLRRLGGRARGRQGDIVLLE